jgi:hypothetical protein
MSIRMGSEDEEEGVGKGCAGLIQIKQCWLLVMDNAYQADSSRTRTWLLHYIIIRGGEGLERVGKGSQALCRMKAEVGIDTCK